MWMIPLLYGLVLAARLWKPKAIPAWLAPLGHVVGWGVYLNSLPRPQTELSISLTMSWALLALVVSVAPVLFDRQQRYSELHDAGLLLGGVLSLAWIISFKAHLATPLPQWELAAGWLADLGGGLLLFSSVLCWRVYLDGPGQDAELLRWLHLAIVGALLVFVAALFCSFQQTGRLTLSHQGHGIFILLALGGLVLPPQVEAGAFRLSRSFTWWSITGASFTLAWGFVRLFALV